jgi:sterol desaturase/sphingolipid hydroxylase (fatty acid hydroxylase superfamily)
LAVSQILSVLVLIGACFVGFGALGRLAPCNPGRPVFFSKSIALDLGYGGLGLLYAAAGPAAAALVTAIPGARSLAHGGWIAAAPLWAQTLGLLAATDFAQYWVHRGFHSRRLWPWHAVHHSAPDVNWTTTFRTHPVNYLVASAALGLLARLVGFSETAILVAAPVFFFSGAWTHANLDWTFGPLRYVIASPVFHRWHHSAEPESREKNYAPMFPVWDLMFGTFYMPSRGRHERFGADGVPGDMLGQLFHPLRSSKVG